MIQKKYYEKLFLHINLIRDIFSLKDFLTRLPSTNFLESDSGQSISNSNELS